MMITMPLQFDYRIGMASDGHQAHLPKFNQGVPYSQRFRVYGQDPGVDPVYIDFAIYDEIWMQIRSRQDTPPLLDLRKSTGNFETGYDDVGPYLRIVIDKVVIPSLVPNPVIRGIQEQSIVHDMLLYQDGVEAGRFVQGGGYIVLATTRPST